MMAKYFELATTTVVKTKADRIKKQGGSTQWTQEGATKKRSPDARKYTCVAHPRAVAQPTWS